MKLKRCLNEEGHNEREVLGRDKRLRGEQGQDRRVEARTLQVAPSPPKLAGNRCHSLSNMALCAAESSTSSIPVSQWHVNDKSLITPLINRMIFLFPFFFPSMHFEPCVC